MRQRISNSFALIKASARVLSLDKELMVFPLLSGAATLLVVASFAAPFFLTGSWTFFDGENLSYSAYVLAFLFYMAQYTVIFFFNAALVGAALIRLDGGDPSVGDGLAIASKRLPTIIGYAAIAATVGMILKFIQERAGIFGRFLAGFMGMAWTLTTYLTVPILVTKNVGPIDAVKESAQIFKRTWGEQVVGNFGMSWGVAMIALGWTGVNILAMVLFSPGLGGVGVGFMVTIWITGYVFLALFASALSGIYTAALYRYAMTGDTGQFDASIMGHAFRPKG